MGTGNREQGTGNTRIVPCSLFPVPCSLFPVPCSLFPAPCSLCLERLLLRSRKQHVVQNQPIPRRILVQRQVGRRAADDVLWVFGIVATVIRPRSLSVIAVDVLDPGCSLLEGEHGDAGL